MNAVQVKSFLKKVVPAQIYSELKKIKDYFADIELGNPIVQIYLNDGGIRTHLGINDFFEFLVADVQSDIILNLKFYNSDGKMILESIEKLKHGTNLHLTVDEIFKKNNVHSTHGLVTIQMKPVKSRKIEYKRMGLAESHFYVFYEHLDGIAKGSLGHIHPSSALSKNNKSSGNFISNQSIKVSDLNSVCFIQANPSFHHHVIRHELIDINTKKVLAQKSSELLPLSVKLVEFDLSEIQLKSEFITVSIDRLPSSNSKPLIVRKSKKNQWTYSHS